MKAIPNQRVIANVVAFHKAHKNNPHKFKPIENHPIWTDEVTFQKIQQVKEEIAEFNRKMIDIDSQIIWLIDQKELTKVKVSRKYKYLKQLENQFQWDEL
jgi:hypothetical protein